MIPNERFKALTLAALLLTALCTASQAAAGGHIESRERIRRIAEAHALAMARSFAPDGAQVRVEAANVDPRLRLPACPHAPKAFNSPAARPNAYLSVGVRCSSSSASHAWSLYVPVRVSVKAKVVVLADAVPRGQALAASDVRLELREVSQLGGAYLTSLKQAEGMVLRRPVRPGTALSSVLLEHPDLVRRGQRVQLVAGRTGIAVSSEGEALADAAEGERVRVRNLRSHRVVEGTVDAAGRVHTGG